MSSVNLTQFNRSSFPVLDVKERSHLSGKYLTKAQTKLVEIAPSLFHLIEASYQISFLPRKVPSNFQINAAEIESDLQKLEEEGINPTVFYQLLYMAKFSTIENHSSPFTETTAIAFKKAMDVKKIAIGYVSKGAIVTTFLTVGPFISLFPAVVNWADSSLINTLLLKSFVLLCPIAANGINFLTTGTLPNAQVEVVDACQHQYGSIIKRFDQAALALLELHEKRPGLARCIAEQVDLNKIRKEMERYFLPSEQETNTLFYEDCCKNLETVLNIIMGRFSGRRMPSLIKLADCVFSDPTLPKLRIVDDHPNPSLHIHSDLDAVQNDRFLDMDIQLAGSEFYTQLCTHLETFEYVPTYSQSQMILPKSLEESFNRLQIQGVSRESLFQLVYLARLSEILADHSDVTKTPFTKEACEGFNSVIKAKQSATRWLNSGGVVTTLLTVLPILTLLPTIVDWSKQDSTNDAQLQAGLAACSTFANAVNYISTGPASDKQISAVEACQYKYERMRNMYMDLAICLMDLCRYDRSLADEIARKINIGRLIRQMEVHSPVKDLVSNRVFYRDCCWGLESTIKIILGGTLPKEPLYSEIKFAYHLFRPGLIKQSNSNELLQEHKITIHTGSQTAASDVFIALQNTQKSRRFFPDRTEEIILRNYVGNIQQALAGFESQGINLRELERLGYLTCFLDGQKNEISPFTQEVTLAFNRARTVKKSVNRWLTKGAAVTTLLSILSCINLIPASEDNTKLGLTMGSFAALIANNIINLFATGIIPEKQIQVVDACRHQYQTIRKQFYDLAVFLIELNAQEPVLARLIADKIQLSEIRTAMESYFLPKDRIANRLFVKDCCWTLSAAKLIVSTGKLPIKPIPVELKMAFDLYNRK